MRRAQGIGINIVIISAIALLVLLIVAMVVTQGSGNLNQGLESCVVKGGQCYDPGAQPLNYVEIEGLCEQEVQRCYAPS